VKRTGETGAAGVRTKQTPKTSGDSEKGAQEDLDPSVNEPGRQLF
jgi:hypothetical protein